jgi:signal transduction histidine kinase
MGSCIGEVRTEKNSPMLTNTGIISRMAPAAPRLSLVLLLLAAGCIFAGGVVLSRREHVVRETRDREPLRRFAAALQKELLRLEALHEHHLESLSSRLTMADALRTQQECENIVGVVECTFLPRNKARAEENVRLPRIKAGAYARPTFETPTLARPDLRVLDPLKFGEAEVTQGWLEDPGWPMMYWNQSSKHFTVFLTIEPRDIQVATSGWISDWLAGQPGFAHLLGEDAQLLGPDGASLGAITVAPPDREPPHWSQVLATRYGSWHLVSWDQVKTQMTYHAPTLAVACTLAVMLGLLGFLVHAQQSRAHRLAMQRVSFVNRVSHELRTPLTNMLLNLDIIEDSLPHEGRAASRLALVREEAGRLARLIANVLTFSKREQGALKLRPVACRPAQVVDAVLEQFSASFSRHGITVTRDDSMDDTPCGLDPDALSQITANLLSNVEKYAPGAPVGILTAREGSHFVLQVSDGGPGIAGAEAERIFEPFVRLDDRVTAGVTGTGLGLSIASELAARMGGSLSLQPDAGGAGKGASFVLRVPVADVSGQPRPGTVRSTTIESASS